MYCNAFRNVNVCFVSHNSSLLLIFGGTLFRSYSKLLF